MWGPPRRKEEDRGGKGRKRVEGKTEDRLRGCHAGKRKRGYRRRLQGEEVWYTFFFFSLSFFFLIFKREMQQRSPGLARCSSPGWVTASLGKSQLSGRDTQEEVSGWTVWIFLGGL